MTADGVIGVDGKIPWHYPADLKRFKRKTLNSTVVMGRRTWESLPIKPLPQRQNIVVTSSHSLPCESYSSLLEAIAHAKHPVWYIGGREIYREAVDYCEMLDVTLVPDHINSSEPTRFPDIDWTRWQAQPKQRYLDDERLYSQIFLFKG